jgi:hypothetical protein
MISRSQEIKLIKTQQFSIENLTESEILTIKIFEINVNTLIIG